MLDRMFSIGVMFTRTRTGDSVRTGRVGDQVDTGVAILRRRFLAMSAGVAGTVVLAACGSEEATAPASKEEPAPAAKEKAKAETTVRVAVPNDHNLQWMSFWTAIGAGFFKNQGLAVELLVAEQPTTTSASLLRGEAAAAVLPPPQYLSLIAEGSPILLFANLLQNDAINLVVSQEVMDARKLSPSAPLAERLEGLQGLKVGVATGPVVRLRTLFTSASMDADRVIEIVRV